MTASFVCLICRRTFIKVDIENVCKSCEKITPRTLTHRSDPHHRDDVDGYNGSWSNAVKDIEDSNNK